ncbi:MAG TPA: MaoC family dehydratase [Acidimicrobiales bacterium]|nr:MaoC family dehydratase [Acidimicrobiales bacterium]
MSAPLLSPALVALTGSGGYFEDFWVGQKMRHARAATVGEVENGWMSKLVMNTAQAHWNEHYLRGGPLGEGRVVFGLITASVVIGLTSQDTAENALAELSLDGLRFLAPVHHGDTLRAFTEVIGVEEDADHPDAGRVRFHHWGLTQDDRVVFEGERTVLIKRRSHWSP